MEQISPRVLSVPCIYIPPSDRRSGGRKELRGVVRLCWSESGAPHTDPPPRLELGHPRLDTDQVST